MGTVLMKAHLTAAAKKREENAYTRSLEARKKHLYICQDKGEHF